MALGVGPGMLMSKNSIPDLSYKQRLLYPADAVSLQEGVPEYVSSMAPSLLPLLSALWGENPSS